MLRLLVEVLWRAKACALSRCWIVWSKPCGRRCFATGLALNSQSFPPAVSTFAIGSGNAATRATALDHSRFVRPPYDRVRHTIRFLLISIVWLTDCEFGPDEMLRCVIPDRAL